MVRKKINQWWGSEQVTTTLKPGKWKVNGREMDRAHIKHVPKIL